MARGYFLDTAEPDLDDRLQELASQRAVVFCGLPATGKSLLAQQLATLAVSQGRRVRLLQWDFALPAVEASPAAAANPSVDTVSSDIVIRATGLWAREAVGRWQTTAPTDELLVVEAPLIGGR